jgi:competence protein ComEC
MQLFKFTILKLAFFLVIGILLGFYGNLSLETSIIITFILVILLSIIYGFKKTIGRSKVLFGLFAYFTVISLGILIVNIHNPKNQAHHYTNSFNNFNKNVPIVFKVKEVLKPSLFYDKYVIDFKKINGLSVKGKSLLNIQKDSTQSQLRVDNVVFTKTTIKDLIPPLNPDQFNYKAYLKKQNIYHQIFLDQDELYILEQNKTSIFGFAAKLRETINLKLKANKFKPDELAIINALLLGQRKDISKEIYNNYAQAGAIHILAVSGLHVGIILLILNFIFRPIEQVKNGLYIKTILIVILLWCFAIIAGLSPSVTRAVTMFSIVAVGLNFKRATNIYNTLAISLFILLLIKPTYLFDVGFQLSYLAVFSIVWIQPFIYKLWQILTVTIAAQFGVLPISLYYFHQFPGLFFLSNLIIIPVLGFILGFGVLVILLAVFNALPPFMASTFGYVIKSMNAFVAFISDQESFLFKDISFGILSVISSYLVIIAFVKLYQRKTYKHIIFALSTLVVLISVLIYNNYASSSNEFLVLHKSRFSMIGIKQNRNLKLFHNLDSLTYSKDRIISNYKVGHSIKNIELDSINSVYKINNKLLLVVDSLGIYKTTFKPDYLLLRNSPKINLNRLIDLLEPTLIIADGSNYKSYQERWSETCVKKEIPFHQTSKKGAFIIAY